MSRWAIIVIDNSGREVISSISQMEGGNPPDIRKGNAKVEEVGEGVKIGMERNAAGGFSFPGDDEAAKVKAKAAAKVKPGRKPKEAGENAPAE